MVSLARYRGDDSADAQSCQTQGDIVFRFLILEMRTGSRNDHTGLQLGPMVALISGRSDIVIAEGGDDLVFVSFQFIGINSNSFD